MKKIKKILKKLPITRKIKTIFNYTERHIYDGNKYINVIKYLPKFKTINISNYSNYKKIKYKQIENNYFYYYIDEQVIYNYSKETNVYENFSLDYGIILENSLLELNTKYHDNLATNLFIQECKRIIKTLEGKETIKSNFANMLNGECQTFEEAIQRILFANQIAWQTGHKLIGLGRLDILLEKYYQKDLKDKIITKQKAVTLLQNAFSLLHKNYKFKSSSIAGDTGQVIILGGLTDKDSYFNGDLTSLIM